METDTSLAIIILIIAAVILAMLYWYHKLPEYKNDPMKEKTALYLSKMRRLWTERSYLTRMTNVENMVGYAGSGITNQRLEVNGKQLGKNMGNMYGTNFGDKLTMLLNNQSRYMLDILDKTRKNIILGDEIDLLKNNAHEIGDLLSKICVKADCSKLQTILNAQIESFYEGVKNMAKREDILSSENFNMYNKYTKELTNYLESSIWKDVIGLGPRYL